MMKRKGMRVYPGGTGRVRLRGGPGGRRALCTVQLTMMLGMTMGMRMMVLVYHAMCAGCAGLQSRLVGTVRPERAGERERYGDGLYEGRRENHRKAPVLMRAPSLKRSEGRGWVMVVVIAAVCKEGKRPVRAMVKTTGGPWTMGNRVVYCTMYSIQYSTS